MYDLLDLCVTKNYLGYEIGVNSNNFLDENYDSPHGFSQNSRSFNFILKRKY